MAAHCGKVGLIMRTYYSSYVFFFLFFFNDSVFRVIVWNLSPSLPFSLILTFVSNLPPVPVILPYFIDPAQMFFCIFSWFYVCLYIPVACICSLSTLYHQIHVNFCIIFTRSSCFPELALESYRFHDLITQEKSPWVGVRQMRILFTGALANHRGNLEGNNLDSSLQFSAKYGDKEQRILHLSSPNKKNNNNSMY